MSLFHKHRLILVAKTYAEPLPATNIKNASGETLEQFKEIICGTTTFIWKCSDVSCGHVKVQRCLGKIVE